MSPIAMCSVLINGLCRKWEVEALEDLIIQMKGHIDLTEVYPYTDVLPVCTLSQWLHYGIPGF